MGRPEGKGLLGGQGVDGRIILKWIYRKRLAMLGTGLDLGQDRDQWRVYILEVMNLREQRGHCRKEGPHWVVGPKMMIMMMNLKSQLVS